MTTVLQFHSLSHPEAASSCSQIENDISNRCVCFKSALEEVLLYVFHKFYRLPVQLAALIQVLFN